MNIGTPRSPSGGATPWAGAATVSAWPAPAASDVTHDLVLPHEPERVPPQRSRRDDGRVDGLDGLRGVAVVAVLVFHLWPSVLPGGFIGVTLFFALSGFLITSILLREMEGTGTISLRRFYRRRVRRLLPPSLATIALVAIGWSLAGWFTPELRRATFVAVGQGGNWGQILSGQKYGTDASASPLLHFWSLAIEEQLYLVVPLALLLCGTRRRGQVLMGLALAGSVYAVVRSADSATWSYYSTFTRGGEVLVGALAALTMHGHRWTHALTRWTAALIAGIGMAALAVVAVTRDVSDPLFARGGLLACAVVSEVVIVAVVGWPALGRRIDWWPLARMGQISYAVYLFHWPLLQTLRRTDLSPQLVPWVTLWSTLLLALLSERWFERPIRTGVVPGRRLAVALVSTALVVPVVGLVGVSSASASMDFEAAAAQLDQMIAHPPTTPAPTTTLAPTPTTAPGTSSAASTTLPASTIAPATTVPPPVRVGFFGDSKALTLGLGSANHGFAEVVVGTSFTALGCPVGRGGKLREHSGAMVVTLPDECDWQSGIMQSTATNGKIDVAVVWSGTWDLGDRKVPALGGGWTSVDDLAYRQWLVSEMIAYTDEIVTVTGAHTVLWLTVPAEPSSHHAERYAVWTELVQDVERMRPDVVRVVDMAGFVTKSGEAERLLPDGIHPTVGNPVPEDNTGAELMARLIIPLVVQH